MAPLIVLDTNVMLAREAARQLRIPPTTLTHWLEGGERRGNYYQPVLREEPSGSNTITWGEMVEARYLRAYRSSMRISMQRLRPSCPRCARNSACPTRSRTSSPGSTRTVAWPP